MSTKDNGGNAFPSKFEVEGPNFDPIKGKKIEVGHTETYIQMGMTLRDYFAAKALQGMLAYPHVGITEIMDASYARHSYELADAMLKERAK